MIAASPPFSRKGFCVPSERVQRQIDRLLDEAEAAITELRWQVVRDRARAVLALDAGNEDARSYLDSAERELSLEPAVATVHPAVSATATWRLP